MFFVLLDTILLPIVRLVNSNTTNLLMDFKTATDRLTDRITADDLADAFGVARNTIARARLDPSSSAYRSPPENWPAMLAQLARERSKELEVLADALEKLIGIENASMRSR